MSIIRAPGENGPAGKIIQAGAGAHCRVGLAWLDRSLRLTHPTAQISPQGLLVHLADRRSSAAIRDRFFKSRWWILQAASYDAVVFVHTSVWGLPRCSVTWVQSQRSRSMTVCKWRRRSLASGKRASCRSASARNSLSAAVPAVARQSSVAPKIGRLLRGLGRAVLQFASARGKPTRNRPAGGPFGKLRLESEDRRQVRVGQIVAVGSKRVVHQPRQRLLGADGDHRRHQRSEQGAPINFPELPVTVVRLSVQCLERLHRALGQTPAHLDALGNLVALDTERAQKRGVSGDGCGRRPSEHRCELPLETDPTVPRAEADERLIDLHGRVGGEHLHEEPAHELRVVQLEKQLRKDTAVHALRLFPPIAATPGVPRVNNRRRER